jgi:predicted esterase
MSIFKRSEKTPEPVKVAWAAHQAEAELISNILREEGIPCLIKRNKGFDVPDFLAAGARDVYVPASAAERAKEILDDLKQDQDRLPGS